MTAAPVVSDSSPLIALDRIGKVDLLRGVFSQLLVPPAVIREIGPKLAGLDWVVERPLQQPIPPRVRHAGLGPGENEAVSLAVEVGADRVVVDDRPARRLARSLGVPTIGTLGVLLACKRRGLIPAVRPLADALIADGFRISASLYQRTLVDAGEDE